jgi:putative phosphoribosyl transferase
MQRQAKRPIVIHAPEGSLHGDLVLPVRARGLVIFAHGSGSDRYSPRNLMVARALERASIGSLLFDLLTEDEEEIDRVTREYRFDIDLLADRLSTVTHWALGQRELSTLPIGFFGASTGAAAALIAAARSSGAVRAIVSRGGRPDLAMRALPHVTAPTLLIVGEKDRRVLDLNHHALSALAGEKKLAVIPDATHLFEEPGTLEMAARLASEWFRDRLVLEEYAVAE